MYLHIVGLLCLAISTATLRADDALALEENQTSETTETALEWAKRVYTSRNLQTASTYEDTDTGYKSLVKVIPGSPDTIVIAFRGTHNLGGIFSDVALNYPQFQTAAFLNTLREVKRLLRERNYNAQIISTGHSSGGALAEAFSYEILKRATPEQRRLMNVDLITWNGIGASDWYQHQDKNFSIPADVASHIRGTHFRASTDYISRIGRHLTGSTWSWDSNKGDSSHKMPISVKDMKKKGLTRTDAPGALRHLTTPTLTRRVFLRSSQALIAAQKLCRVALGRNR